MQPDFGTMLVLLSVAFFMLFAAASTGNILFMASAEPRLLYIYLLKLNRTV